MLIRYGYEMAIVCPTPTPVVCQLDVHPSLAPFVRRETPFTTVPDVEASAYVDAFGNLCRRFVAPAGRLFDVMPRRHRGRRHAGPDRSRRARDAGRATAG